MVDSRLGQGLALPSLPSLVANELHARLRTTARRDDEHVRGLHRASHMGVY